MSRIFSLTEGSSIPYNIFASSYLRENYVESSIRYLSEINELITKQTKELYSKILESENVEAENSAITDFVSTIQQSIDKLLMNIKSSAQRFNIAVSNLANNTKDKIEDGVSGDLSKYSYIDKYIKYDRSKMTNSDVPQMNPYKIFERDFNVIGQLMQDLPVSASNKDKLEIVSTVYKNFKKYTDSNIIGKTYQDLFGIDCTDKTKCPTSIGALVCGMFVISKDDQYKVDFAAYNDAVECIENCDEFIDSINQSSDHLINELNHIVSDLSDILYGNKHGKFKVDTEEDGIRNTSYSVDKYTSNQIMWLVQEKIRQIVNVFNKYILALSVKMECICNYMRQSTDIINSFIYMDKNLCANSDSNPEENEDNNNIDDNNDEGISQEEEDESKEDNALDGGDDILTDEDETENDVESDTDESDDENDIDTEAEDINVSEEENDDPEVDFESEADEGEDIKEAAIDMLTSIHGYNMIINEISILEYAATILMEDENPENKDKLAKAKETISKANEQRTSVWQSVMDKILSMWNSFKDALSKTYNLKVEKLKEAGVEKYIKEAPISAEITMPTIDFNALKNIKIEDLNYDTMKEFLGSKEDFIKKFYETYAPKKEGDTVAKAIEDSVIKGGADAIKDGKNLLIKEYWEYVSKYPSYADEMRDMINTINQGQRKAASIAKDMTKYEPKTEAATLEELYFNEDGNKKEDEGKSFKNDTKTANDNEKKHSEDEKVQKERADITKQMGVYFGASGDILHGKIVTSQKVFNQCYAALMWHCNKMKEKGGKNNSGENKKIETPTKQLTT